MSDDGKKCGVWTEAELAELKSLSDQEYTYEEAAIFLNRGVEGIKKKASILNLRFRQPKQWRSFEIQRLKLMASEEAPVEEIAHTLGKTCLSVTSMAHVIGVSVSYSSRAKNGKARWTDMEREFIQNRLSENESVESIAHHLGRSPVAVRNQMARMGLRQRDFQSK